jgi:hypothetical protein
MPKRLALSERTVKMEVRLPVSLKREAERLAKPEHEGNVSFWIRAMIRRESLRCSVELKEV